MELPYKQRGYPAHLKSLKRTPIKKVPKSCFINLVPRAHVPFGQHQDTELWNNQFPETKILGLSVSRPMRALVYMASRDKVDVDTFHKDIQNAHWKNWESRNLALKEQWYQNLKAKEAWALGTSLMFYRRGLKFVSPQRGTNSKTTH